LLGTLLLASAVATGYPSLRAASPGRVLAEDVLTVGKLTTTLSTGVAGPYDLTIAGKFKQRGTSDAEVGYAIKATSNNGGSDEVSGSIKRQLVSIRSRRGPSTSLQEHTEATHRLPHVRGNQITLTADGVDDQLDGGLQVAIRRGGLDPTLFIVLGMLALLLALMLDARLVDVKGKVKSHLTAAVAVAFAFSLYYPTEATPHATVRPAVSAFLFALVVGGLSGWLAGGIVRFLFGPKIKKSSSARR
jgi:hypothetical protein